jgi:plastocyanin
MLTGTRSTRGRIAALAALLAVAAALVSLLALPAPAIRGAVTHEVTIVDFAFGPADLTIQVGDTVRWTNQGGTDHTATSTSGPASFSSPGLATGATFEFTFTVAGVYEYRCSFHPSMTGGITVEAPATPTPVPTQGATATPTESASAEETALPDASVPDRSGADLGGLLWALLAAVVLAGMAVAGARRT